MVNSQNRFEIRCVIAISFLGRKGERGRLLAGVGGVGCMVQGAVMRV